MQPATVNRAPKVAEMGVDKFHWRLSLIRQSGDVRVALLNGKLVNVGGRIQGALVSAIDMHQVTLRLPDDRLLKLELPSVRLRNGRD